MAQLLAKRFYFKSSILLSPAALGILLLANSAKGEVLQQGRSQGEGASGLDRRVGATK